MKVTHLLLCSLAVLSLAACKKKSMPVKQTPTVQADSPNVANAIDSQAVAAHRGVDTYTGVYTDNMSNQTISFYITHLDGKNYGKAIFRCSTALQVDDIEFGPYSSKTTIYDTIPYRTSVFFVVGGIQFDISGKGELGDSLLAYWTYEEDRHFSATHNCSFMGRRVK